MERNVNNTHSTTTITYKVFSYYVRRWNLEQVWNLAMKQYNVIYWSLKHISMVQ